MTAVIGTLALIAGLTASIAWSLLWLRVALSGSGIRAAQASCIVALLSAVTACGALEWALVAHDFTVQYVAENGDRSVPLYFTVTSLWSALDGSLLLWLLILAAVGSALAWGRSSSSSPHRAWAMVTTGIVAVFFFALVYFAANPFELSAVVPIDGLGPNPLLREHPAIGVHPPLLYAGFVGMVVPFGYAVAALVVGGHDDSWLAPARRWALGAWVVLTVGILLGAWWSYAVLGWGGYWAWDPVENASLLPWLTATAALHVTMSGKRSIAARWAVGLFSTTFILVLVGTFLTRSGAVASVHSFTESPLGPMLLGFIVLVVGVVTALVVRQDRAVSPDAVRLWSRDSGFLYNAILLIAVAAVVLTGTVYPLIGELLGGGRSTVDAGYYNRAAVPVLLAVMLVMGVAQLVPTDEVVRRRMLWRLAIASAAGLITIIAVGSMSQPKTLSLLAFGLAAFVLTGIASVWFSRSHRRMRPGLVAHGGLALVAIGIAASSSYTISQLVPLRIGDSVTVNGISARLIGVDRRASGDRTTVTARLDLGRDGQSLGQSAPVLHYYPARDTTVSVPSVRSRLSGDVYTTVTAVDDDGARATIRLAVNPFVPVIWLGGAVIALGGALALLRRRQAVVTELRDAEVVEAPALPEESLR